MKEYADNMPDWATDYLSSGENATCWASDSGKSVKECWCAQCTEARLSLPMWGLIAERNALQARIVTLEAIRDSYKAKKDEVRDFIQASIDREEWTADELSEIFWEELAEILDLSLNLFEEKSITLTIEQAVTVKVKRGYDISGYDFDIAVQVDGSTDEVEVLDYDSAEVTDWNEM
jgi:hypothetical protein